MKLVGSAVISGLHWAGMSKKAHSHDWMLRRAFFGVLSSLPVASPGGQVGFLVWCLHSEGGCPLSEHSKKKEAEAVSSPMFRSQNSQNMTLAVFYWLKPS